jgi:hypothetical protein
LISGDLSTRTQRTMASGIGQFILVLSALVRASPQPQATLVRPLRPVVLKLIICAVAEVRKRDATEATGMTLPTDGPRAVSPAPTEDPLPFVKRSYAASQVVHEMRGDETGSDTDSGTDSDSEDECESGCNTVASSPVSKPIAFRSVAWRCCVARSTYGYLGQR